MDRHTSNEWLHEGTSVYGLNLEGTNRFHLHVQGGWATHNSLRTDESELVANARLISSAPELLEALRLIVRLRRDALNDSLLTMDSEYPTLLEYANAAIAKATGESK